MIARSSRLANGCNPFRSSQPELTLWVSEHDKYCTPTSHFIHTATQSHNHSVIQCIVDARNLGRQKEIAFARVTAHVRSDVKTCAERFGYLSAMNGLIVIVWWGNLSSNTFWWLICFFDAISRLLANFELNWNVLDCRKMDENFHAKISSQSSVAHFDSNCFSQMLFFPKEQAVN